MEDKLRIANKVQSKNKNIDFFLVFAKYVRYEFDGILTTSLKHLKNHCI
jgi:hypothetical protein